MKNWIVFISIFLVSLTIVITTIVLIQAREPYASAEKLAEEKALSSGHLDTVSDSYVYRGLSSNLTVIGSDGEGRLKAVFIPSEEQEGDITEVLFENGKSKEEIKEIVRNEMEVDKILHARLGVEEVGPVWEVAFIGKNDKLNYVYILFENGQWWKRILNL